MAVAMKVNDTRFLRKTLRMDSFGLVFPRDELLEEKGVLSQRLSGLAEFGGNQIGIFVPKTEDGGGLYANEWRFR
jgi:hypothetical protein